jgi:hypothetical protein
MAQTYSVGVRTPAAAAAAAYCALRPHASSDQVYVKEIGLFLSAATATSLGLIRAATVGTATTSVLGQAHQPGAPVATANLDTAWSTAPTVGSNAYLRRLALPATSGIGVIWTFQPGAELIVGVNASVLIWNFGAAAGAALDAYMVWDE